VANLENSNSPYLALLTVQALFGSLPVIGKVVLTVIPAVSLVGFRVGITAVVLAIIQISRRRFWLKCSGDYVRLGVLSLFGVTFNQLLFITGLSLTKASNTSLLAVTIPIFAMSLGAMLGYERIRFLKVIGIIIAATGVVILIDPRNSSFSAGTTIGDILIIANSLSFGIYVATSKSIVTRNGAFRSMMWIFLFAALICVPIGAFSLTTIDTSLLTISVWGLIFYIALFATAIPYLLNAWALARVNPSTLAVFIYLQPLIGFTLAAALLGEAIDARFLFASTLVFLGVYLVTKKLIPAET
jgi:drug/metabolite transporter (DMT)-like permease